MPDKYEVPCPNGGEPFKLGRWVARKRALYRDMRRKGLVLESGGDGGGGIGDGGVGDGGGGSDTDRGGDSGGDSDSDSGGGSGLAGLDAGRIAALDALGFVWVVRKSPTPG